MVDLKRNGFDFPWELPTWWIFKEENPILKVADSPGNEKPMSTNQLQQILETWAHALALWQGNSASTAVDSQVA